ncbi:hypothetical protein KRR38_02620 [Novosphingobium sp. G106]|uniref:hypothetical protein n=1 Tax=Novosphingobium sp. G106 TaxID=2849500 RepID=UPI001C2D4E6F|nr:hypothetical protein [Novosphingobium sp. G106]MBV1686591.1 hypothetical protein [Novosphingobium sp. G106]
MMWRIACGLALIATMAGSAAAQPLTPSPLTPDQKGYIVYDRCMMHAAIVASHTDASDDEIFALAKSRCASTRAAVILGQENNRGYLAALDAADADKSAHFPAWIKGVRERRSTAQAGIAVK